MPETPEQFHARIVREVADHGYRESNWSQWTTWPFDAQMSVRPLDPPSLPEPPRAGESDRPCDTCVPAVAPIWQDEYFRLGLGHQPSGLPFAAWLMPHTHGDLGDLDDAAAARMGVILVHLDRAIRAVLDVGRVQIARWADGGSHLHLYVYARPAGLLQLRGTFLALWDDLLPAVPADIRDTDSALVAAELTRTAGGSTAG